MKTIKRGLFALSVVVTSVAARLSLFSKVWIPRIVRALHASRRGGTPKTPYKTLGMVHANDSSVMEPSALFNDMGTSAVCLLLILGGLVLGGLSFGQTARAADILISSEAAPETGTFYRMLGPGPLPFNPFPKLPLYAVDGSTNIFLIDDRSYEQFYKERMALLEAEEFDSEEEMNGPAYDYPTNVLWIELYAHDPTNALAYLTLHNTRSNYYYQLLSKLDLNDPEWTFRQIVQDVYGTNQVYFDPVPSTPQEKEFFRGVEGVTVVSISRNNDAREPNSALSDVGTPGYFNLSRLDPVDFELTVVYRIRSGFINV